MGATGRRQLVAQVAMERDLAFVCVPSGTRNHFARDLGLDPGDPIGAMEAFGPRRGAKDRPRRGGRSGPRQHGVPRCQCAARRNRGLPRAQGRDGGARSPRCSRARCGAGRSAVHRTRRSGARQATSSSWSPTVHTTSPLTLDSDRGPGWTSAFWASPQPRRGKAMTSSSSSRPGGKGSPTPRADGSSGRHVNSRCDRREQIVIVSSTCGIGVPGAGCQQVSEVGQDFGHHVLQVSVAVKKSAPA